MSGAECEIRLYRFLIIAFSSILTQPELDSGSLYLLLSGTELFAFILGTCF